METDETLMLAYQKGDVRAFEVLFSRYQREIYGYLYRNLAADQNKDEAFQEVFYRVIRSAPTYTVTAGFATWLYTIARNYCIDLSRKRKLPMQNRLDTKESGAESDGIETIPDLKTNPHKEMGLKSLNEKLERALTLINPDQKEVFLLREKQGLSFEDIAQIVGVSQNTVKSRMRYAALALRDELKKMGVLDLEES